MVQRSARYRAQCTHSAWLSGGSQPACWSRCASLHSLPSLSPSWDSSDWHNFITWKTSYFHRNAPFHHNFRIFLYKDDWRRWSTLPMNCWFLSFLCLFQWVLLSSLSFNGDEVVFAAWSSILIWLENSLIKKNFSLTYIFNVKDDIFNPHGVRWTLNRHKSAGIPRRQSRLEFCSFCI